MEPHGHIVEGVVVRKFSGPLPDPETMAYYERVHPGASREIFEMARLEQGHRHQTDNRMSNSRLIGQIFGFALALTGVLSGVFLVYHDKSLSGLSVFFSSLVALIGASVFQRFFEAKATRARAAESDRAQQAKHDQ